MPPSQGNNVSPYADHGGQSDHAQGPPRKKMRKGTKSCLECRRRKIKCTFEVGRTAVCNECYARGSTCIDQEHGDLNTYTQNTSEPSAYSLRERVSQLEGLVRQVLDKIPEPGGDGATGEVDRSQLDAQAAEVLKSLRSNVPAAASGTEESILLPGGLRDDAPALTLFDNAVLQRKESQPIMTRAQYNKSKTIIAALTQLLPSPQDLDIILESSHEWWTIWRKTFPNLADRRCETMKEAVSHSLRSEKPAEIAKILLCIAISIHQIPDSFDWKRLHLKETRSQLMEKYIETVDRLVVQDDEIAATIDGIECIVLESKYQTNIGRPRRAWLLYRRGISFCQLLGFHRLAHQPVAKNPEFWRHNNVWAHLVAGDRYLSLMLGLPYSVPESFFNPYIPGLGAKELFNNDGEEYMIRLLPLCTKIVDRNQSVQPMPYSATLRLDQELEEIHDAMPDGWWSTEMNTGQDIEDHFDRVQAQFFHHQAKLFLHMPFMLRSSASDKRYQYSHSSALDAARGMIRVYDALRTNIKVGPYICKLHDFQVFTAAMLLLLNLCGYSAQHRGGLSQPPDLEQDQLDSTLIDRTIQLLREAAHEVGGVVAAQSAQALEMMARVREGIAEKDCETMKGRDACQVTIPYFGTISIGAGKQFVPIKRGTYPRPNDSKDGKLGPSPAGLFAQTGLPTPPSITSGSTQTSPISSSLDHSLSMNQPQVRRPPIYESTDFIAPGLDADWPADDPFVTFDSFMALPTQDFDMSSALVGEHGSGFTPRPLAKTPGGDLMGTEGMTPGYQYTFGGSGILAFGTQSATNLDLDSGWNWLGVDPPATQ